MNKRSGFALLFVFIVVALAWPAAAQQASAPKAPPLIIEKQGSFFVGGRDVYSETLSTLPAEPSVLFRRSPPIGSGRNVLQGAAFLFTSEPACRSS